MDISNCSPNIQNGRLSGNRAIVFQNPKKSDFGYWFAYDFRAYQTDLGNCSPNIQNVDTEMNCSRYAFRKFSPNDDFFTAIDVSHLYACVDAPMWAVPVGSKVIRDFARPRSRYGIRT